MSGRLLAGEPYCTVYTLNRGKGLLSRQSSSLPESLCSAGGHWWEVQRRGTPGGHRKLAALEGRCSGRHLCQSG